MYPNLESDDLRAVAWLAERIENGLLTSTDGYHQLPAYVYERIADDLLFGSDDCSTEPIPGLREAVRALSE